MAAHLFNESGQMQEVDIPDIFDVLEGGEDENAVKFLLGFAAEDPTGAGEQVVVAQSQAQAVGFTTEAITGPDGRLILLTKEGKPRKRDPVDPSRCIFNCENCDKAFTTKFNLKRHINLHCSPSKEAGVPVQGPPSASMPSRKARERREAMAAMGLSYENAKGRPPMKTKKKSKKKKQQQQMMMSVAAATSVSATPSAIVVSPTASKPILTTVQSLPTANVVVKQPAKKPIVVGQQQINNNGIQTQKLGQSKQKIEVRLAQPQQQLQQHHQVILSNQPQPQTFQMKQLPEKNFQVIKTVQQQQSPTIKQSVYQPRVVHVVQNNISKQQQQQQVVPVQTQESYQIVQQGMVQGVPVTVSFVPSASKVIFREGVIHLPQQPLPNVQAIQSALQLRPIMSSGQPVPVVVSNVSASASKIVPKMASPTLQYPTTTTSAQNVVVSATLADAQKAVTSNGIGTITASIISSSFLASRCQNSQDLSGPPEELFDSEDDEDASSVATTTEAPSPEPEMNGEADKFPVYASTTDRFVSDVSDVGSKTSLVNVILNRATTSEEDDADINGDNNDATLNLPTIPQRGQLQEIPKGWLRKIITTGKTSNQPKVFYYNRVGKKFSCQEEIDQFFSRLGQTVLPGLFNFEPPRLVDEDDDDDDDDQEMEDHSNFSSLQQKQQLLA